MNATLDTTDTSQLALRVELPATKKDRDEADELCDQIHMAAGKAIIDVLAAAREGEIELLAACVLLQTGEAAQAAHLWETLRQLVARDLADPYPGYYFDYPVPLLNLLHNFIQCHDYTETPTGWRPCREVNAEFAAKLSGRGGAG